MSRFFAASSSSSSEGEDEFVIEKGGNRFGTFYDSEESEEEIGSMSEEGSEEEDSEVTDESGDEQAAMEATKRNRFLFGGSDDDDEDSDDEGQRQVKSQKEKAEEEFEALCDVIENGMDGDEWILVQTEYERLLKMMSKNSRYITGTVMDLLKVIETVGQEKTVEEKKKMSGADAKAFNAVRQKNKKTLVQYADLLRESTDASQQQGGEGKKVSVDESLIPKVIEMIPENVLRKLQEVVGNRGRKHAEKQENMVVLRKLYELCANDRHRIQVLTGTVAAEFDMTSAALGYLPLEIWGGAVQDVGKLMELLGMVEASAGPEIDREAEEYGLPGMTSLQGSLLSFVQRLDDEFTKALQIIDYNTTEYDEFLRGEKGLYEVLLQAQAYFEKLGQTEYRCQLLSRQLDHLYFRPDTAIAHFGASTRTVAELCHVLYGKAGEKIRIRALLSHVYHLALHGHYVRARDIFVASQVADHLPQLEVSAQILYNRTVVQLGLAAFQRGFLKETYFCLQEICSSGRPRELLAQGLQTQKYVERTPEQERAERQRQLPYHMHISIELLDSVFLTVSMLLEIPQAAAAARRFFKGERKLFPSRHLRRLIDTYDRSLFTGPPENTRDYIIAAAKALANGDWKRCLALLLQSPLWTVFPAQANLPSLLQRKVKEAALCTYILAFGPTFTSLSIPFLARTFELEQAALEPLLQKLVQEHAVPLLLADGHLAWAQDVEVSPLHELVLQLKDKLAVLQERNHECIDF